MTGQAAGWGIASRYGVRLPTWQPPLLYCRSPVLDLMHPQSKAFPRTRGLQCQLFTNRTGPTDLTMSAYAGILLKKSFEGDERNFPGPLMRFARRDEEGTTSLLRKTTTKLRIRATEHCNDGVVQTSTFARFLASFDFRLLQHYRGQSRSRGCTSGLPSLARNGHGAMSDLSPSCAQLRTLLVGLHHRSRASVRRLPCVSLRSGLNGQWHQQTGFHDLVGRRRERARPDPRAHSGRQARPRVATPVQRRPPAVRVRYRRRGQR